MSKIPIGVVSVLVLPTSFAPWPISSELVCGSAVAAAPLLAQRLDLSEAAARLWRVHKGASATSQKSVRQFCN